MGKLTDNNIVYSKITQIYYKRIKGELYKFPSYAGADSQWDKASYSKDFKGSNWVVVTTKQFIEGTRYGECTH